MRFSVFTASTPTWTQEEAAQTLASQGWDGIEWGIVDVAPAPAGEQPSFWAGNLAHWPLTGIEQNAERIRAVTADAGLEISAIAGYAEANAANLPRIDRLLAATAAVGGRQLRVNSPTLTPTTPYPELMAETRHHFEWIARRAERHGVKAVVETHHRLLTSSASAALRLVDGLDPRHVGVIHDLGNTVIEGHEDHLASFQLLGDYLAHVHVKNAVWEPAAEPDAEGALVFAHRWATLRTGQASVRDYFAALRLVGYDGWVTVEDFTTELPLEERTRDNLAYLRAVDARVAATPVGELLGTDPVAASMNAFLK